MPIDIRKLGRGAEGFLKNMLPYLVRQKFQKQMLDYQAQTWLEKSLKEYEAYGGVQEKLQSQAAMNAIFGDISDAIKGGVKGAPYPGMEFIERGQRYGLPMGEVTLPPEEERIGLQDQYRQAAMPLIMARMSGQKPSQEDVTKGLTVFGRDAVYEQIGDFAEDVIKRAEQDLRAGELRVTEAQIPIKRYEAETKRIETGISLAKLSDQERKDWISFVEDIEDHLRAEGIKGTSLTEAERAQFGQGKIMDPLSAANRGKAYTFLGEIRAKLIKNQKLTDGEIRFLTMVRSSAQIEKPPEEGGGLVDPTTGLTELETRNSMLAEYMAQIKEKTGITDEESLRKLAEEFLRIIK